MFDTTMFCERLKDAMADKNNMTSTQLAQLVGVTTQTVNCWKRGEKLIYLSNLVKVANALNCTIDYLLGRNESFLDFIPKECPSFYQRLRQIMNDKKVTRYRLTKDSLIKESYLYFWKKGADVNASSLIILADYLNCTIDYLVGRDQ